MTPDKALELVHRYSELTWAIKASRHYLAEALDKCTGVDGKRLERRRAIETPPYEPWQDMDGEENEKQTHLRQWYSPEHVGYYGDVLEYMQIGDDEQTECLHCYAAHMQIQKRKAFKRQLASVKAAMTRKTPKPKILDWKPDYE